MPNPKLDQYVQGIIKQKKQEAPYGRYGVVMSYDTQRNTATVLLSAPDSDTPADILKDVPCPVLLGIQTVAPEPGRPCWVVFKGESESFPVVTHYFNHGFQKFDYGRLYNVETSIPSFITSM